MAELCFSSQPRDSRHTIISPIKSDDSLVPRAHDPSGLGQGLRALKLELRQHRKSTIHWLPVKYGKSDWLSIRRLWGREWLRIRNDYSAHTQSFRSLPPQFILAPRAYDPSGLRQESRALGATISGMRHRCRCAVSRITRIRLFPLFFHNGCSQSSRFLPQARRIVGSGVENDHSSKWSKVFHFHFL